MTPRTAHALKLLRLDRLYSGCFLQLNTTTLNLLRVAQPYITWGLAPVVIDFNNICFHFIFVVSSSDIRNGVSSYLF